MSHRPRKGDHRKAPPMKRASRGCEGEGVLGCEEPHSNDPHSNGQQVSVASLLGFPMVNAPEGTSLRSLSLNRCHHRSCCDVQESEHLGFSNMSLSNLARVSSSNASLTFASIAIYPRLRTISLCMSACIAALKPGSHTLSRFSSSFVVSQPSQLPGEADFEGFFANEGLSPYF